MALANGIKIVGEEPYAENLHVRFGEGQADNNHSHYDILTQYKMKERYVEPCLLDCASSVHLT